MNSFTPLSSLDALLRDLGENGVADIVADLADKVEALAQARIAAVALVPQSLVIEDGAFGESIVRFLVERIGNLAGDLTVSGALTPEGVADAFAGFVATLQDGAARAEVSVALDAATARTLADGFSVSLTDAVDAAGGKAILIPDALEALADTTTVIEATTFEAATFESAAFEAVTFEAAAFVAEAAPAAASIGGITILDMAESLAGDVETPVATSQLIVTRRAGWDSGDGAGGAESITFDKTTARTYTTNAADDAVDILDMSNPFAPTKVGEIDLTTLPGYGGVNSVAAFNGIVAVAVQIEDGGEPGLVALYDADGALIKTITVGVLPDQLTFSPDGKLLIVANEGEPYFDEAAGVIENAAGSISIIDISQGASAATVRNTIGFTALDGSEGLLAQAGIKIFEGSGDLPAPTASQDIEPEYVAVSPDGTKAYVTLQEVNAVAVIDLTDAAASQPVSLLPLGYVDFALAGNEGDFSDRDGAGRSTSISVGNAPVKGLLQPDAIASFEVDGTTYFVTANEGDSRIVNNGADGLNEARASALGATDADYARYNLDTTWSSEGEYYGFGGRGFSIFRQNDDGTIVKVEETGGDFEQILATLPNAATTFNGENGGGFDTRSDNKSAEPEGVAVGEVSGKPYVFVSLERMGGVMVWDVSNPEAAKFVTYMPPTSEDYGPEVIKFVSAKDSPTGEAFVMTANEISGTVTVYEVEDPNPAPDFTLQLLHFSDAEAGLLASSTAPNLAALVDAFEDDYANTLVLSGGDNFIPGPFLAAGTDPAVRDAINAVTGSTMTGTIPLAAADIAILNTIGVDASALGNHDFDLGSNALASALAAGSGWVGAQFVSVSANLVVGPSSPYYTDPAATDSALNALYVDTIDYNIQAGLNGPATATLIPEASALKGKIVPATVITMGDEKIGIVGATTQILESISSPSAAEIAGFPGGAGANGEVDDMDLLAAQLQPIIDEMIAEGVDKIILQSHLQSIENEIALAGKLKGVDIIQASGSHTRMGDATDTAVELPGHAASFALDYPYLTTDAQGDPTLIVVTDNEYTYLGRLVVDFDADGKIIIDSLDASINGAYAATDANVAAAWGTTVDKLDETAFADGTKGGGVKTITDAVQGVIDVKDANVYGYTDVYLEGERSQVRNQETNLGNITADANGDALAAALKNALGIAAEDTYVVSLKNGGGIRAQIGTLSAPDPVDGSIEKLPPEGGVSQLDVENALRFDNKLMAFDTTPEGLKAILEHGVAVYGNQGRFPQIGGVSFSFDPDAPAGSRILDLALIDEAGNVLVQLYEDGVALEDVPSSITVVALNFLADGGDGYPVKANAENFRYLLDDGTLGPVLDETLDLDAIAPENALGEQVALERYLKANFATKETAYTQADTGLSGDTRIQNLNARDSTVLDAQSVSFSGSTDADIAEGGALADQLSGNGGADLLKGHGGNDTLRGGAGNDLLFGGSGDDILLGGADDDTLFGGDQDDILEGGKGTDELIGGRGSDTYVYSLGDGSDTIVEGAGDPGDADILAFEDVNADEATFTRQSSDVVITLADGSRIVLKDQTAGGGVESVTFADGESLDRDAILASIENSPPVAAGETLDAIAEDAAAFEVAFAELLANDSDADDDALAVTGLKNVVGGTAVLTATGVLFTPAADFSGAAGFTYTVADGKGGTADAKAVFTVTPVNDAPVAGADAGTAGENESKLFDLLANDTDADGDALALAGFQVTGVSGIALDPAAAGAAFSIENGKLRFAPGELFDDLDDGENATVTLAYTVGDGHGGTATGSFVLNVEGESDLNPITGTAGNDRITGTALDDLIEALGGRDRVNAGDGDDVVFGGAGNDALSGEGGNDTLDGGAGRDTLRGGAGADTFVFRPGYGRDTVADFGDGDVIELDADVFADFAALEASGALTSTFFSTQIAYDDGSRLTLSGVTAGSLTADDFRFV